MQIFPIVSSSDGNCTYIETGKAKILIDCGITLRDLTSKIGVENLRCLDAVFVTHEHQDHIKGLGALGRRFNIPIYINQNSHNARSDQLYNINWQPLERDDVVIIRDIRIIPFDLFHDTVNAFGFMISERNGQTLCYMTDTGVIDDRINLILRKADVLFIECNYNETLLRKFPDYPSFLKSRIRENHLSNSETLGIINDIGIENFSLIIPAHLSPRTNSPEQLTTEIARSFAQDIGKFSIAPFAEPIEIGVVNCAERS